MTQVESIKIECPPNPFCRVYHVRNILCKSVCENYQRGGAVGNVIAKHLLTIPGVVEVYLERYKVMVVIAETFDWSEIEPAVKVILANA